jgi:hypothetical protein
MELSFGKESKCPELFYNFPILSKGSQMDHQHQLWLYMQRLHRKSTRKARTLQVIPCHLMISAEQASRHSLSREISRVFRPIRSWISLGFALDSSFTHNPDSLRFKMRGSDTCELVFEDCEVPDGNLPRFFIPEGLIVGGRECIGNRGRRCGRPDVGP